MFQGVARSVRPGRAGSLALVAFFGLVGGALATGIGFTDKPGTHAPPAKLHGFSMKKFGPDHRKVGHHVGSVTGPTGKLVFSRSIVHLRPGRGWGDWSNEYDGDVYFRHGDSVSLTLPAGTKAFYFYVEPNKFGTWPITARSDGSSSRVRVTASNSGGAKYFGFFANRPRAHVAKITVTAPPSADGFAIGEFGIH